MAHVNMDRTSASARLQVLFALPYEDAEPVIPESLYALCRVILRHNRDLPGCSQPVCVEWANCELDYWLKDTPIANKGERFVSYASELSVCGSYEPASAPPAATPALRPPAARRRAPAKRAGATRPAH
jgi:hypothetical protein